MRKVTFRWFKKPVREPAYIALDIGTETVKAVLFSIEDKAGGGDAAVARRAIVKGFGRVKQFMGDISGGSITDISNVIANCQTAIKIASHEAKMTPEKLILGVAGEFVKGATSVQSCLRDDPDAKIDPAELNNIVNKLQWRAFDEVRKLTSEETGYPEIDIKLINTSVVDVRIDGYRVSNPLGFQGKEIEMAIFNAFSPIGTANAIENIAAEMRLELLGIVSESYAISRCTDMGSENLSAIFIDVGGGSTDIAVLDKGVLAGTKMFGIGGRAFTKRLAIELNIAYKEAEKLKYAYTEDRLEQKSKKIINGIIKNDIDIWLDGISLALSEFSSLKSLPHKILLSGGGTYLPEIKSALNNEKWHKRLHFARTPQATYLHPKDLPNLINETKNVREQEDITPLALVNIGIELTAEETEIQKAIRKVIGIMKV